MKESGRTIISKAKDFKNLVTDQYTRGVMYKENLKDAEGMNGKTEKYIKENGKVESNMGQEFGEDPKETLI